MIAKKSRRAAIQKDMAMDPLDDPGSLWLATSLGSFPAVSGPPPAARRL